MFGTYTSFHVKICFICVKPAGHRAMPGWAFVDVSIYRHRPAPVQFVARHRKNVKIVRCSDDYQIRR